MSSKVGQLSRNDVHQRTAALWSPYGDNREGGERGTGFWLGKNRLLTANHVCASDEVHYRWADSREWQTDGRVLARDETLDVAVVEIAPRNRDSESTRAWFFRPTEKFEANFIGYPKAQEINGKLRILDVDALCMPFEGFEDGLLRGRTKRDYSLSGDEWGGVSGAGFILNGALAGVVIEAGKDMVQARALSVLVDKSPVWPYIASCLASHSIDFKRRKQGERLVVLYRQRDTYVSEGKSTNEIHQEIVRLKRELRAAPELDVGDIFCERYQLVERLGRGGFATVWRAWDRRLNQSIALKVLHGQFSKEANRIERFERGAKVMHKLTHPYIVRVLEPSMRDDGHHGMAMELIEGGDLQSIFRSGRTIEPISFLRWMLYVGEGVGFCHTHPVKIIHRDLKPANILLTKEKIPKISDFDLVRTADSTGGTRTGALGTIIYSAPECMIDASKADVQADVFSLSMISVVGLLGGEEPNIYGLNPPKLTGSLPIKKSLQEFLARGISLEPSERPENASIWTEELQGLIKPKPPKKKSSELWVRGEDTRLSIGGVSFKMIWIEPGTFWMGSPHDDDDAYDDEKPRHQVTLTGFWMAETPCTQALWEAMTGKNPSEFKGAQNPVDNVSWDDIQAVLRALNERQSNLGLRLPTEAEWEYACRAGTQTPRYGKLDEVAWHRGNSNRTTTHPVGQKTPNPWGLYDTLGNVWEWCQDGYRSYSKTPVENPLGPKEGVRRVLRGGSWSSSARYVRAAYRVRRDPTGRNSAFGFRLSRGHGAPSQSGARRAESASRGFSI